MNSLFLISNGISETFDAITGLPADIPSHTALGSPSKWLNKPTASAI